MDDVTQIIIDEFPGTLIAGFLPARYRSSSRRKITFDSIEALVEYLYIACDLIDSDK